LSVAQLFVVNTADAFLAQGLAVAQGLGITTTTWRSADPTKSLYNFLGQALAAREPVIASFIRAGSLSSANDDDWLTLLANDVYGVPRRDAIFATSIVTLTNTGGGYYPIVAGDLTFKCTATGKTYHNTGSGTLTGVGSPGATLTLAVIADESGPGSSAGVNGIDTLVTSLLGVNITSSTIAVGLDRQDGPSLKAQALSTLGALSPGGPADAYNYVCRNPALTGVQDITRASAFGDNTTCTVTVYIAGAAGPVASPSVVAAQAAVNQWATPLGFISTVVNAVADTINVSANATPAVLIPTGYNATAAAALSALFASLPIGTGAGYTIDPTTITSAIRNAVPAITGLPVYSPAAPIFVAAGHVPVLGSVVITPV
ncbi:MAG: baseplate J/gp47 family protein, partial [Polyangiaceae bacterium]